MSHDNELRSRLGRLADSRTTPDLTFEAVEGRRAARRGRQQRMMAVGAVFALVLGTVGVISLFGDDSDSVDVASDVEDDSTEELADDETAEPASTTTVVPSGGDFAASTALDSYYGGGPDWILPWGDGFLSLAQVFEPSGVTFEELVPDLADRLSPEIIAAIEEAGVTDIPGSIAVLTEAGLIDQATAEVTADPVLFDAYAQVTTAGTTRLEASVSPDGENWTVLSDFALPTGSEYFNSVQSDGEHLVISEQTWDEETGTTTEILISSTTDLVNWTSTSVPIERPDVPDYVHAEVGLNGVAISGVGWYATLNSSLWVDLWSLLPADLRTELESDGGYGWSPSPEGLVVESYPPFEGDTVAQGSAVEGAPATTVPEDEPIPPQDFPSPIEPVEVRTIPWSELGITYDEYMAYEQGVPPGGQTAQAWVGGWDGSISAATPATSINCCQVISTDAGFLAQSWGGEYLPTEEPTVPELHFSPDGQTWTDVTPPSDGWLGSLAAVEGGVLLTMSGQSGATQLWRGDATGSGWQTVDIPGLPANANIWFNETGSRGVASVIDVSTYDEPYEQVEFEATMEWDGFSITTFNHSDGSVDVEVTAVATGDVVLERAGLFPDAFGTDYFVVAETGVGLLDDEGEVVVTIPGEVIDEAMSTAMEAAQEAAGWVEPDYEYTPDLWFVASVDGISWFVEDLAEEPEGDYFGQAALNGTTALVREESGWRAITIG